MTETYRELLLGCGYSRKKLMGLPGDPLEWENLTTLDNNPYCTPDIVCDLRHKSWVDRVRHEGLPGDYWNEVHAYEVLEHFGRQGNPVSFFDTFNEIYRILKPNGLLFATTPSRYSPWLWGDPGHCRVIIQESLIFLDRDRFSRQFRRGDSPSADYRSLMTCDFDVIASDDNHMRHAFALRAVKPARPWGNKND